MTARSGSFVRVLRENGEKGREKVEDATSSLARRVLRGKGEKSASAITLLASFIGVIGALSGLVVERLLRTAGRVWCEPTDWEKTHLENREQENWEGRWDVDWDKPGDATHAGYSVWLDLYNSKEIPVGLRAGRRRAHGGPWWRRWFGD
jgi:hypothetical protein